MDNWKSIESTQPYFFCAAYIDVSPTHWPIALVFFPDDGFSIGGFILGAITSSPLFVLACCCVILIYLRTFVLKVYQLLEDGYSWLRNKLGCSGDSESSGSINRITEAECVLLEGISDDDVAKIEQSDQNAIHLPMWYFDNES